jgi:hypothetical protein
MHFLPACVCWATRWHTSDSLKAHLQASPVASAQWESGSLRDLVLLPMLPYLLWAVLYYIKARSGHHNCCLQGQAAANVTLKPLCLP